ncbi:efflux RND transporter periplasmic adaptor subunit [Desulfoplanes formicivorans]|uniref:RND family efflux transporter MFP subunit n=1 Tax=Desulfoplanes formicivorans TaxID=1592317 RepID=A0A194ADM2_9BACT|nr:efflux RND transporter periplasmic adaptor subunit [Desulfoplanes formicivorans]GAU08177.1 RND family efflux transporter MFP subunit [Desulfoplanes formicivorans]
MHTPSLLRTLSMILGLAALVGILVYQTGMFTRGRIKPGTTPLPASIQTPETTLTVTPQVLPLCYTGVGTITARTTADIAAQVTAKITAIKVHPGDRVKQDDILVVLDNRPFKSRMDQARQGLLAAEAMRSQADQAIKAARARFDQTRSRYKRMQEMFASRTISSQDLEVAQAEYLQAQAGLEQAKQGLEAAKAQRNRSRKMLEEAAINLGFTTIKAPMDGDVARRLADPGDLAVPGQPLLTIHAGEQLRIEAVIREGLMGRVALGQSVPVDIASLNQTATGIIEEIVPTADPRTRTFMVKAALPEMPGIYPGMFGRLRIPVGQRKALLVPRQAIKRVGQLETVLVREGDHWERIFVTTGPAMGDRIEILSGLNPGDVIGMGGIHD